MWRKIFKKKKKEHHIVPECKNDDRQIIFKEKNKEYRITSFYVKNFKDELARLCDFYGSDKGEIKKEGHPYPWPSHNYTDYYSQLFSHCRNNILKIFECGIGTTNPDFKSSMGASGKPGASLRVWRDYFPKAMVYGADIDREALFQEERIKTYYIDQLNPEAIRGFWSDVGESGFDLIVDDGLHNFEAGSTLFSHSSDRLSSTGIYIIEDVNNHELPLYADFFRNKDFVVQYVILQRPILSSEGNNLIVIRKI